MDCQRIRNHFQQNMQTLLDKYKIEGNSRDNIFRMLVENTNFVMSEMFKECLALSREGPA